MVAPHLRLRDTDLTAWERGSLSDTDLTAWEPDCQWHEGKQAGERLAALKHIRGRCFNVHLSHIIRQTE